MHVFVTGGSGLTGPAVVAELIRAGHTVTGLARSDAAAARLESLGATPHPGSLDDLDSLRMGAEAADGVLHMAFGGDFADPDDMMRRDRTAIETLGRAIEHTGKPFVSTSGTLVMPAGRESTERDEPDAAGIASFRIAGERACLGFADRGVRASVVRLAPAVHGPGDYGFIGMLVDTARKTGKSAYVGDGGNRWPAVHRLDAAVLFRLALEQAPAGSVLHGTAENVPFRGIAETIGRGLDLPRLPSPRKKPPGTTRARSWPRSTASTRPSPAPSRGTCSAGRPPGRACSTTSRTATTSEHYIRICGYSAGMRVLVVGQGPVARVLATSLAEGHRVGFAVRERTEDSLLAGTGRLRIAGPARRAERRVGLTSTDDRATDWDVVISTASPASPGVAELFRQPAVVAAVTQVPSEVELLRELAGERSWGLVVPEFFAAGTDPTWWWPPARSRFTVAGPASASLGSLFTRPRWSRTAPLAAPLVSAATMMPVAAGLHAAGFDLAAARRSARRLAAAATQARTAVAAGFGGPRPRPVRPQAVRAALAVLPRLAPFDVPDYLRTHFGGHSAQTLRMLRDWVDLGRRHGVPVEALEELLEQVPA